MQIPVGATIDARKGRVNLVSAADRQGTPQLAWFYDGVFKVGQTRGAKPITDLKLAEALASCPKAQGVGAAAAKKKTRKLWGEGKGAFRTTRQVQLGDRARHQVGRDRPLRRDADPRDPGLRHSSATSTQAQERHRQGRQAVPGAQDQVSWVSVFAGFLVAHMVGDYLLQTDWQARHKRGGLGGDPVARRALVTHVTTYTLAFVPALIWIGVELDPVWAIVAARADLRPAPADRRRPPRARSTWPASSASTGSTSASPPRSTSPSTCSRCCSSRCWWARHEPRRRAPGGAARGRADRGRRSGIALDAPGALRGAELATRRRALLDPRRRRRRRRTSSSSAIDDKTLDATPGRSRSTAAPRRVIEQLAKAGAAVIAYDVQFTEAERRPGRRRRAGRGGRGRAARSCSATTEVGRRRHHGDLRRRRGARRTAARPPAAYDACRRRATARVRQHALREQRPGHVRARRRAAQARARAPRCPPTAARWIDFPGRDGDVRPR